MQHIRLNIKVFSESLQQTFGNQKTDMGVISLLFLNMQYFV